jgi:O-acetyl-ADP-ribose deacetylase (regulator of RNase III)
MITYHTGDLLQAPAQALVNTVNTVGVMGKGIALQFKEQFKENLRAYLKACKEGTLEPGKLLVVRDHTLEGGEKVIVNFPTKTNWKQKSKYSYIEDGLRELARIIPEYGIASIAIPPLGCGNGGLEWDVVKPMMEQYLGGLTDVDVQIFEPNDAVKSVLQQQSTSKAVSLTPARAIFLYSMFAYEALGEPASLFVANKLAYFLQRMGEDMRLKFTAARYGPYADGVRHVLYRLNGTYLMGLEQQSIKPFEPVKLNYDRLEEVVSFISKELSFEQQQRLRDMLKLITGFESALSLEVLGTVAFILEKQPAYNQEQVLEAVGKWSERKKAIMPKKYIDIAYSHLHTYKSDMAFA